MTLLEMLYTAQHLCQVFGKNTDLSLEQFNNLVSLANQELFKEIADGYLAGDGAEVDARVQRAIQPFKFQDAITLAASGTSRFGITGQLATLNADAYRYMDFFVVSNTSDYPDKMTRVDIVTASEAIERMSNSIVYPSSTYPIIHLDRNASGTTLYGYVIPSGFTTLYGLYIKKPTTPILVLSEANGVYSQDASSTALDWDSMFHIDILRIMLKYLGLIVGNDQIIAAIEQDKMQEK